MLEKNIYEEYIKILKEELIPAMGCTEPIALAYGGAVAREYLGAVPEKIIAKCSGNMIKNVRCVTIPNSDGLIGIEAGVVLGAVGGDAKRNMEVLENVTREEISQAKELLSKGICQVELLESKIPLHIILEMEAGSDKVTLEIQHDHMNITRVMKNGEVLMEKPEEVRRETMADRSLLDLEHIKEFADTVELEDIMPILDPQIKYNMEIAKEGMSGKYGVGIGRVFMENYERSVLSKMRSLTSSASEARMGGCDMPVIINSGSGNQGIACSIPVIVYVRELEFTEKELYRALAFSNLLTIYQKMYIGKLSAFCGAVSASCASGAAITYLCGGSIDRIQKTIENTLANIPGIICDGAKISCASKIASCVDAAYFAHHLAMSDKAYQPFTGILQEHISETISCVGAIGKNGMKETDEEILRIMLGKK